MENGVSIKFTKKQQFFNWFYWLNMQDDVCVVLGCGVCI